MSQAHRPRLSLILSFIACVLCLAAIPAVMICLPSTATKYLSEHEPVLMEDITFIIAMLYVGMVIAAAVLVLLILLLRVSHKGSIFTPVSGRLVLAIALLVIAVSLYVIDIIIRKITWADIRSLFKRRAT